MYETHSKDTVSGEDWLSPTVAQDLTVHWIDSYIRRGEIQTMAHHKILIILKEY